MSAEQISGVEAEINPLLVATGSFYTRSGDPLRATSLITLASLFFNAGETCFWLYDHPKLGYQRLLKNDPRCEAARMKGVAFDMDRPKLDGKKNPWTHAERKDLARRFAKALDDAGIESPFLIYDTPHGLRCAWWFNRYASRAGYQRVAMGLYAKVRPVAEAFGLFVDNTSLQWQRGFRVPDTLHDEIQQSSVCVMFNPTNILQLPDSIQLPPSPEQVKEMQKAKKSLAKDPPVGSDPAKTKTIQQMLDQDKVISAMPGIDQMVLRGKRKLGAPDPGDSRHEHLKSMIGRIVALISREEGFSEESLTDYLKDRVFDWVGDGDDEGEQHWLAQVEGMTTSFCSLQIAKDKEKGFFEQACALAAENNIPQPLASVSPSETGKKLKLVYFLRNNPNFRYIWHSERKRYEGVSASAIGPFRLMCLEAGIPIADEDNTLWTDASLLARLGESIDEVIYSAQHRHPLKLGTKLVVPLYPNRPEPEFNATIDGWLYALAQGEITPTDNPNLGYALLHAYIKGFANLSSPAAALVLFGHSGGGKTLLQKGLTQMFGAESFVTGKSFFSGKSGAMKEIKESPVIAIDESMGDTRVTRNDLLEVLSGNGIFTLEMKYANPEVMWMFPRLVFGHNTSAHLNYFAASNEQADALSKRVFAIQVGQNCAEYISDVGHDTVRKEWDRGGALARHLVWMSKQPISEELKDMDFDRFGVHSVLSGHHRLEASATASLFFPLVDSIFGYKGPPALRCGFRIIDQEGAEPKLFIMSGTVSSLWNHLNRPRKLHPNAACQHFGNAFKAYGAERKRIVSDYQTLNGWVIPLSSMQRLAEQTESAMPNLTMPYSHIAVPEEHKV